MKKFFERDYVLKFVSILIALLVWLYVIYVEDPEIKMTISDVPVTFAAAELSDDLALIDYDIKTVDIKISGNRSEVMDFEKSDLSAVLDLSLISEAGEYDSVKISVSSTNKRIEIVDVSNEQSEVRIDDVISKKLDIKTEFEGDMGKGLIVADEPQIDVSGVWVKGAKSCVETISGAYIKIDLTELEKSKTIESKIYLKDKGGNVIDKNHKAFKLLTLGEDKASVYVEVGKTHSAKVEVLDVEDREILSISPSEVEIYSKESVDKIYTKSIKGKEADEDGYITVKLNVPEEVTLVNSEQTVKIKVK